MAKIVYIFMILLFAGSIQASAFIPNEIEWAPAVEGTLYMGNNLTNGPYTVRAIQFSSPVQGFKNGKGDVVPDTPVDPMAYLEVYKDGNFLKDAILSLQSGPDIDQDYEVMVSSSGFPSGNSQEWVQEYYKPWAKVAVSLRGKPKLDVTVSTEKTTYTSGSDQIITAKVELVNNGDAVARNVDVVFNVDELKLRGGSTNQLHPVFMEIKKGETKSFEVVLMVPELLDDKSYSLTADVKSFDVKNLVYKSSGSKSITVAMKQNYYTLSKAFSKDRIYLNDIINVRLTIANSGTLDMNDIVLNDSMNSNFQLISETPLFWNFQVLHPGEWKDIEYSIKPLETNLEGFTFPEATAGFKINGKKYNISSDLPLVVVNGPKIFINKTVDKQTVNTSEDVTVTVRVENMGNIPTRTEIKDFLPENVSIVNGSTSFGSTFLEIKTPIVFSYVIRINSIENIELPAAIANYTNVEYRGMKRSSVISDRPVIIIFDPAKNSSTNPVQEPQKSGSNATNPSLASSTAASQTNPAEITPTPITPGFNIVAGVIVLIFAAFFRRR